MFFRKRSAKPRAEVILPGRETPIATAETHFVNGNALKGPAPKGFDKAMFGLGCFWGAEKLFWQLPGIHITAAGYAAGTTPNPTYEEVCSGRTGHNEVVLAVYNPSEIPFSQLLQVFWEGHNPTQGMRQGNDTGTQYRSGIYVYDDMQRDAALRSKEAYNASLKGAGFEPITTEILDAPEFYFAEEYHQQYLAKNPSGYCGLGGTGVSCQIDTGVAAGV